MDVCCFCCGYTHLCFYGLLKPIFVGTFLEYNNTTIMHKADFGNLHCQGIKMC